MEFKVLTTADKEWNMYINSSKNPDVYFLREYTLVYEQSYTSEIDKAFCGKGRLFVLVQGNEFLAYAGIMRKVNEKYYDLITPYGYSGIIGGGDFPERLLPEFRKQLYTYCQANNIICAFTRYNPLFNSNFSIASREFYCKTVFVDLTGDSVKKPDGIHEQVDLNMSRKTRNQIKKAKKLQVVVEQTHDPNILTELYLRTMQNKKVSQKYLFPFQFFSNTLRFLPQNTSLFTAKWNNIAIAAALFIHHDKYFHYHFSGSDERYKDKCGTHLILHHAIHFAKDKNYCYVHLGGAGSPDEKHPLLQFKKGFSPHFAEFTCGKDIFMQNTYEELSQGKQTSFFPAYRD